METDFPIEYKNDTNVEFEKVAQQVNLQPRGNATRYLLRWRASVLFGALQGKPMFHGMTYDLSMNGASIIIPRNVVARDHVSVRITPPVINRNDAEISYDVEARQTYSILSGKDGGFRIGLEFLKFKHGEHEQFKARLLLHKTAEYRGGSGLTQPR